MLSHHYALAVMAVWVLSGIRFEHRFQRFLELQEERIVSLRHQQGNPASPSDATNPDDLDGRIYESVSLEKHAPVVGERFAVGLKNLLESPLELGFAGYFRMKN